MLMKNEHSVAVQLHPTQAERRKDQQEGEGRKVPRLYEGEANMSHVLY